MQYLTPPPAQLIQPKAIERMRKTAIILLCLAAMLANAQMRRNSAYQTYINQYKDLAIEQMLRYKIPASITLAQGLFESAAGRSELTRNSNNHFGIKCHGWKGRKAYHDDDEDNECFRAYENAKQSYEDHSKFLANQPRYSRLFSLRSTDYKGWARGLKACGYATNPRYADKLIQIIELYGLNEFDKASRYDKFLAKHSYEDRPASSGGSLHSITMYNDNYYVIARPGDTFRSIAEEVGISYRKIASYNERDRKDQLVPGERIYLKKKRKKAEKRYKRYLHTVKAGESMYSIAQAYGIRIKSLYKKNKLDPKLYEIKAGDRLKVY